MMTRPSPKKRGVYWDQKYRAEIEDKLVKLSKQVTIMAGTISFLSEDNNRLSRRVLELTKKPVEGGPPLDE